MFFGGADLDLEFHSLPTFSVMSRYNCDKPFVSAEETGVLNRNHRLITVLGNFPTRVYCFYIAKCAMTFLFYFTKCASIPAMINSHIPNWQGKYTAACP